MYFVNLVHEYILLICINIIITIYMKFVECYTHCVIYTLLITQTYTKTRK